MIRPRVLVHKLTGNTYAFRGFNQVAWRFGGQVKIAKIKHVFGPFWRRLSDDFFEDLDRFGIPENNRGFNEEGKGA